ncbi:unnamed protein product [Candidula unifasciata]|uniref:THD domain-containing protein n=1 Tax=Candidula unifasciata TaxID=100452 RepID=A0A8S3ZZS7_9EUPU|nr:unnamed protein product [Candidula unifasciata]
MAKSAMSKLDRPRTIITAVNVGLCLSILLAVTIVIKTRPETNSCQPPPAKFPEICIDCTHLPRNLLTQPEVSGLAKRHGNNTDMCCAETQDQMSTLLQAIVENQPVDPDPAPETSSINMVPVSAHKRILSGFANESALEEPYFNGGKEHFITNFSKVNDPVTEHAHGVEVLDSALKIETDGLYYVYISIHTGPEFNIPAKNFTYQSWFQYVYRRSPHNPANSGALLQMAYPAHEDSVTYEETDYRGGTFHLNKGDELLVCITGVGLFRYRKESSFLGVIMVNNETMSK